MHRECRERFPRLCGLAIPTPDMHHGTCVTRVPRCMPGSLTSGFLWSPWRGKHSRHSRSMRNPQFYVSGKKPMPVTTECTSVDQTDSATAIQYCVAEPSSRMISYMLIVNGSKMRLLIVASKQQLPRVNIAYIQVGEDQISYMISRRNWRELYMHLSQ